MKHPHDQKTMDMLGEPKRRGRPPKEDALTPAQRQARYRAKKHCEESRKRGAMKDAAHSMKDWQTDLLASVVFSAVQENEPNRMFAKEAYLALGQRMGWISVT